MLRDIVGDNRDEARRQTALGNKRGFGDFCQFFYGAGAGNIFGEVQVMDFGPAGGAGNIQGEVVGAGAEHREMPAQLH